MTAPPGTASPPLTRYRFSVEEYLRMGEAGIFSEDDRVELIDGEVMEMAPIGEPHIFVVHALMEPLVLALKGRAIVRIQSDVVLGPSFRPQPDLVVLRFLEDRYPPSAPAGPGDVLLIIEVAESSLAYDRDVKLPLYAAAGVPEAWVVALPLREVLVARNPSPEGYRTLTRVRGSEPLSPLAFPDLVLTPQGILSPER